MQKLKTCRFTKHAFPLEALLAPGQCQSAKPAEKQPRQPEASE